uniref:Uncharacterized protein n=1 Tax=Tanacetum cinerariifolium TaxID=118510 RepID=A0A699HX44_TANCI|nr:hypothetical protein [Tanacetum cinerariifolium]
MGFMDEKKKYYIFHVDGSPASSKAEHERVIQFFYVTIYKNEYDTKSIYPRNHKMLLIVLLVKVLDEANCPYGYHAIAIALSLMEA